MAGKRICAFVVDDRIFNRDAILKTAYLFIDDYFVYMSYEREHFVKITVEAKPGSDMENVDKRFCNELLAQMLRYRISIENKNIKELIIGRALYSTCIDTVEDVASNENQGTMMNYSLNDIAVDWFEVYEEETNSQI